MQSRMGLRTKAVAAQCSRGGLMKEAANAVLCNNNNMKESRERPNSRWCRFISHLQRCWYIIFFLTLNHSNQRRKHKRQLKGNQSQAILDQTMKERWGNPVSPVMRNSGYSSFSTWVLLHASLQWHRWMGCTLKTALYSVGKCQVSGWAGSLGGRKKMQQVIPEFAKFK